MLGWLAHRSTKYKTGSMKPVRWKMKNLEVISYISTRVVALLLFLSGMSAAFLMPGTALGAESGGISVGLNNFDLLSQYLGTASGGNGTAAYSRVTRAMARKALDDARDAGVRLMRVPMGGRPATKIGGRDSLDLWRSNPEVFWRLVDQMMDDLDARDIRLVPVLMFSAKQFAAMSGETVGDLLRDSKSKSWGMLSFYVSDFVTRYRNRPTILFYELTNEFNNGMDLDNVHRCAKPKLKPLCEVSANYSTDEMIVFIKRFVDLIRNLDNSRHISSGFSIPRSSAEHLRGRPEWSGGGPDWTLDTRDQFVKNLKDIHAHVDIVSIHLYGGDNNKRFGSSDAVDLLVEAKRVADSIGKPLFVGEFGDPNPTKAGADSHVARMISKMTELRVSYSAVWVWEFYQNKTYLTHDNRNTVFSLEPGYTNFLIDYIREANGAQNKRESKLKDTSPPRVVLTWPLECMMLNKTVDLHAVASDDSGAVQKVKFLVDGEVFAVDDSLPYQATFSSMDEKAGIRRLTARAYDFAGNVAEFSSNMVAGNGAGGVGNCTVNME